MYVDTNGNNYKKMADLNFNDGGALGSLTLLGNTLYGMLAWGQPFGTSYGNIISIDTNGNNLKDLYNFDTTDAKGYDSQGSLTISGNIFYGMTFYGGTYNNKNGNDGYGVIFSFKDTTGTITSTNKLDKTPQAITLFPNPNNGKFIIQSSVNTGMNTIEVYNMTGQRIYAETLRQTQGDVIDLTNASEGIYLYRVLTETGSLVSTGKFVIQK